MFQGKSSVVQEIVQWSGYLSLSSISDFNPSGFYFCFVTFSFGLWMVVVFICTLMELLATQMVLLVESSLAWQCWFCWGISFVACFTVDLLAWIHLCSLRGDCQSLIPKIVWESYYLSNFWGLAFLWRVFIMLCFSLCLFRHGHRHGHQITTLNLYCVQYVHAVHTHQADRFTRYMNKYRTT